MKRILMTLCVALALGCWSAGAAGPRGGHGGGGRQPGHEQRGGGNHGQNHGNGGKPGNFGQGHQNPGHNNHGYGHGQPGPQPGHGGGFRPNPGPPPGHGGGFRPNPGPPPGPPPGHGSGHGSGHGGFHHPAPFPHHQSWHVHTPPPRPPVYVNYRPSVGIAVALGALDLWFSDGLYYQYLAPGRYEVVMPPIGMLVPQIAASWTYRQGGLTFYVNNGVVYNLVNYRGRLMFQVVGYQ